MHVITEKRIWEAKAQWPQSATALDQWYRLVKRNNPRDFAQLKAMFPATDRVGSLHVFNIGGNKLRLIAVVHFKAQRLYIKQVLDHREYDKGKWRRSVDERSDQASCGALALHRATAAQTEE